MCGTLWVLKDPFSVWLVLICDRKMLFQGYRPNTVTLHVGADLGRNFFKHLLVECASCNTGIELHKLNDVTSSKLSIWVTQAAIVTIKLLHCGEVGITHSHDDDWAGVFGQLADGILSVTHVMNRAISQKQQNRVLGLSLLATHHLQELCEQWVEKGRAE